ncbi:hypothetical protein NC99_17560 [Sunxiuqinia dokdonensis]|uniref:Uncharacterized protein n=1 Tax=Sunxiuqinia dokdonensis TaxID=1409788 RepID=A0A0L8VAP9_9BACT|nr:hypothetical protein NC99_17560 [Sunxiuqinia dokdonensis]
MKNHAWVSRLNWLEKSTEVKDDQERKCFHFSQIEYVID